MKNTWGPLAITLAIQATAALALLGLPVMAPVVAADLAVPASWVGIYVSLAYVGAMTSSLAGGAAVDKLGPIRASQVALVLCAIGLTLNTAGSLLAVAAGAVLAGLGYGLVNPASSHVLTRTTAPHRLSLVFSLKQTGVPLGGLIAGAAIPSLLLLVGWRASLLGVALVALACTALAEPLRATLDTERNRDRPLAAWSNLVEPLRLIASHRMLTMLAACSFVFSAAQLCLMTYLVTFLYQELGFSLVTAGLALSIAQAAGIVGRVFWGWVSDRFLGARRMLAVLAGLMTLSCIATAMLSTTTPVLLLSVVLAIFGASAVGWNGVYLAEVARCAPKGLAGVATGGTLTVTFFGVVVGPPVFSLITDLAGSYRAGYAAVAVLTLVCGLALAFERKPGNA